MRSLPLRLRSLLCALFLLALRVSAPAQHYSFQYLGQAEGLHNLNVTSMLQDQSGAMWIGTENGLYRYDGARFYSVPTVEGLDDHDIAALHQDAMGRIWVASLHDLFYLDHSRFIRITEASSLQTDLHSTLASFSNDPNRIFLLNNHVLSTATTTNGGKTWKVEPYFSPQYLKTYPQLSHISGVVAAPKQSLWLGCDEELCLSNNNSIKTFGPSQGLPKDQWKPALVDRHGALWARGVHHIASCTFDKCTVQDRNLAAQLEGSRNRTVAEDTFGNILINIPEGLAKLNDETWKILDASNGIPSSPIQNILVDRQGSPWLALTGHGLARWKGSYTWEGYTTAEGLADNQIWGIYQDKKGVWIGSQKDLQFLPHGATKFQRRLDRNAQPLSAIQALAETQDGRLWGGGDTGDLVEYDTVRHRSRVIANLRSVISLLADPSDRLWICTNIGLYMLDTRDRKQKLPSLVTEVPKVRVYKGVQEKSGSLWFMSNAGLYRFSKGKWKHIPLPKNFRPQFAEHIAIQPDGSFWLNGVEPVTLLHARMKGEELEVLEQISSEKLSSSEIVELDVDTRGWLWVGTDAGIDVYDGKSWRRITENDGLIWNDIDGASFFAAPDGTVWIGTSGGAAHLLHPEGLFHIDPLTVRISAAQFGAQAFGTPDSELGRILPWSRSPFSFHLATSDLANSKYIVFRYRLANVEDWNITTDHDLHYPPLSPGDYRLEVIAENTAQHNTSPIASFEFTILAPWWRSTPFLLLLSLLGVLLILLIWRWSVRMLVRKQQTLERLIAERTAELQRIATRDSLTGLLNRAAIFDQLEREINRCRREGTTLAIAVADIDHFKDVNDTYGHLVGDFCLKEYANRITATVRSYDYVGRYGGEELLILFPNLDPEIALQRVEDLREVIEQQPFRKDDLSIRITSSFGLAWYDNAIPSSEALIEQADQALYRAKAKGRNRVEYYPAFP